MARGNGDSDASPCGDLPSYSLRVSPRAKRMHLKINHWGKVEVVVPRNVNLSHVAPFVRRHRKWLEKTLAQVQAMRGESPLAEPLPDQVRLLALDEGWKIVYRRGAAAGRYLATENDGMRCLCVESADAAGAQVPLRSWIHDYARQRLPSWLRQVSVECRLPYSRATVRAQKTRWGSCSARGHISLNRHLLFLPSHLVRYIMIHELCHTVHLNHSRRYWTLVGRFAPDFQACEAELRLAARHIPLWACPE
ncbi:MAG: SprT family zinc-dependent metalloprotease [Gammaproteobacteria bacterium]|jgi:predicted metal-dependent hydrolase